MSWRVRTRKDGTVFTQVRWRYGGAERSLSFDDHAEAIKFDTLITKVGPAKAMEICRIVASPAQALTVREWLDRHNDHLTGIEPGTVTRYRSYAAHDINPVLGDIPLSALTPDDIKAWVNGLTGRGGGKPSGKTVANKHGYLAGALNEAVARGLIKSNPCDSNRLPRWDRKEMVFLDRDEYRQLLAAVPDYWKPLVEFLVASGCRWSEATALTPKDVDRKHGTVRIRKAWKTGAGGYQLGVPKTRKSVRTINVPSRVLDQLDYDGEWLFTNSGRGRRNEDGPVRIHSFYPNVWQPAVTRSGIDKKPRVHDLRHTCASWLIQAGIPLPVVQQHLGHESITTTVNTYGHLDRQSAKSAADAIERVLTPPQ